MNQRLKTALVMVTTFVVIAIAAARIGSAVLSHSYLILLSLGTPGPTAIVPYGATVTLSPAFRHGTGMVKDGTEATVVASATSGNTYPVGPLIVSQTYVLVVTNAAGDTATGSVSVSVTQPAVTNIIPAMATVTVGDPQAFSAIASGSLNNNINWAVDGIAGGDATVGTINGSGLYTAGTGLGAHTVKATAAADGTTYKTATVTVVAPPTASLVASDASPLYGATNGTITPTFAGATTAVVGISVGGSEVTASPVSGTPIGVQGGGAFAPVTYWLRATNAAGGHVDSSVTITPKTVNVSAIVPNAPWVAVGSSTGISAQANNAVDASVLWSVDGVPGGNSTVGTVTGSNLIKDPSFSVNSGFDGSGPSTWIIYNGSDVAEPATIAQNATGGVSGEPFVRVSWAVNNTSTKGVYTSSAYASGGITGGWKPSTSYSISWWARGTGSNVGGWMDLAWNVDPASAAVVSNPALSTSWQKFEKTITTTASPEDYGRLYIYLGSATNGTLDISHVVVSEVGAPALVYVAPATPKTVTLTATSAADPTKSASTTVTVVGPPVATSLVASNLTPMLGNAFTLTPTYSSGTGGIDFGVVCPATGVASSVITADWTGPRTFTLTVTNGVGAIATATATVTPVSVNVSAITPAKFYFLTGGTKTFSAVATGGATNTLVWSASAGVINASTGAWTAPGTAQVATITATSVDDPRKFSTLAVRVGATPLITSFTSEPMQVNYGNPANAKWTLASAVTDLTLNGADVQAVSNKTIYPAMRQAYTLDSADYTNVASTISVVARGVDLIAGGIGGPGYIDGVGVNARFGNPVGIARDGSGNIYVADATNNRIRKIDPSGNVTTFAGTGTAGANDGPAASAQFNNPYGIALDSQGNVYVADAGNYKIRLISGGVVSSFTGTPGTAMGIGATDGALAVAKFNTMYCLVVDGAGNLYVADTGNQKIRLIKGGVVSSLTGTPYVAMSAGATDGAAASAKFSSPMGIALDGLGNVYVADSSNNKIRMISNGVVTSLTGTPYAAMTSGATDGAAASAKFTTPYGVAVDGLGQIYVVDGYNHKIRLINGGVVSSLTGTAGIVMTSGTADGVVGGAQFNAPWGITVDGSGDVYVTDPGNKKIRKISSGNVSSFAGQGVVTGAIDGQGIAASMNVPLGVATDALGNIYVADTSNNKIRKIDSLGNVTTLAGTGVAGAADGAAASATFNGPRGIAVDGSGNVYVAESGNHKIRLISGGMVSSFTGTTNTAMTLGATDGAVATAQFNAPYGVAVDGSGNVYVADTTNHKIRKISGGTVSSLTGATGVASTALATDGAAASAKFSSPYGVAVDAAGANVYVADYGNQKIRLINGGTVSSLTGTAGTAMTSGATDGAASGAKFYSPYGVAVDGSGNVFVADGNNHKLRMISVRVVSSVTGVTNAAGASNIGAACGVLTDGATVSPAFGYGQVQLPKALAVKSNGDLVVLTGNGVVQVTAPVLNGVGAIHPNGSSATVNSSVVFTASVGGSTSSVNWSSSAGSWASNTWTAPATSQAVTITATSAQDATKFATTTVSVQAVTAAATSFLATSLTPAYGSTFTLTPVYSNGTGAITYSGAGSGSVTCPATGVATSSITANWFGARTYALSVTGAQGAPVTMSTVVTPTPVALGPIVPGNAWVAVNSVVPFGATVTGGNTNTLVWTASAGSINSSTGAWTAPATPQTATITATSLDDASKVVVTQVSASASDLVTSFTASPVQVNFGNPSVLSWTLSSGVSELTLNGASVLGQSSASVIPVRRQTFTLAGKNVWTGAATISVVARGLDLLAGNIGGVGSMDGAAANARFNSPSGVAIDLDGNIYVADTSNHKIRKIDPSGNVTTFAGNGKSGTLDGLVTEAEFRGPMGVAVDNSGNVYVADTGNHKIRKISGGVVSSLAGMPNTAAIGATDGAAAIAKFNGPQGVAVDASGTNVYVADYGNNKIRKITGGVVTSLTGIAGTAMTLGATDGAAADARFNLPRGVAVDGSGNVYVADSGNRKIRMISGGVVSSLTGITNTQMGTSATDGVAASATFNGAYGVAVDASGTNVYVADYSNNKIRLISGGIVSSLTGIQGLTATGGATDGIAVIAQFTNPQGVAVDGSGNVYVADYNNSKIRKISAGVVTTVAGAGVETGSTDAIGILARFNSIGAVATDAMGNTYVADSSNNKIRKIDSFGNVTTFAGTGVAGATDGPALSAQFSNPGGVAVDASGNVYVGDTGNQKIRLISGGVVSSLTGTANTSMGSGATDGAAASAKFSGPYGVAVDGSGNIYVGDASNYKIRLISGGMVSSFTGTANTSMTSGASDGAAASALFRSVSNIALDGSGNLYVGDGGNNKIRKISGGVVSSLTGTANIQMTAGATDGAAASAQFNFPSGIAVDASGNVYVADQSNNKIRKISGGVVSSLTGAANTAVGSTVGAGSGLLSDGSIVPGSTGYGQVKAPKPMAVNSNGDLIVGLLNGIMQVTAPALNGVGTIFPDSPALGLGGSVVFTASVGGGTSSVNWSSSAGSWVGNTWTAPVTAQNVTITATSVQNPTNFVTTVASVQSRLAQAGGLWISTSLTPSYGSTFTLTPDYSNGTATITYSGVGSGSVTCPVSGVETTAITANWTGARTYTLTVTGSTGSPATQTIVVTPVSVSLGAISPANAWAGVNTVTAFGATVTGGNTNNLVWTASAGSINASTGAWTAPGSPQTVTITATSLDDASQVVATQATVFAAPLITTFTAAPLQVNYGGFSTLNWALSTTVTALTLNGADVYGLTAASVSPVRRQTFSLVGTKTQTGTATVSLAARGLDLLAGKIGGSGYNDGVGIGSRLSGPTNVAVDSTGTIYFLDGHTIRKIDLSGNVSTFAGSITAGASDGAVASATFSNPRSIAVDGSGDIYVADSGNNKIRKISGGVVSSLTGTTNTAMGLGSADGAVASATFRTPVGLALDGSGNIYVTDYSNNKIRKISGGVVSSFTGTANTSMGSGATDGAAVSALFSNPASVAVDASGTKVYVADFMNGKIRLISGGVVSSFTGTPGVANTGTAADGPVASARVNSQGLALDASGTNVYVMDYSNQKIRLINNGIISSLTGAGANSMPNGSTDGPADSALFYNSYGLAVDAAGNVYVADQGNSAIRKLSSGIVTTIAGQAAVSGFADGQGITANMSAPIGVATDAMGNTYVADTTNQVIRKIDSQGNVTTFAGVGTPGSSDGGVASAQFYNPSGVAVDGSGNIYVADTGNHKIRKISGGVVSSLTGTMHNAMASGATDGAVANAQFYNPVGVAVDGSGNVYVADQSNNKIRKISGGVVSSLTGTGNIQMTAGATDGAAASAQFNAPNGLAVDGSGNLYVADYGNHKIRLLSGGSVSSFTGTAGTAMTSGVTDGAVASAKFYNPYGIAVDGSGNVYVADYNNNKIRLISGGVVSSLTGAASTAVATTVGAAPGVLSDGAAVVTNPFGYGQVKTPKGIALTPAGDLVIATLNGVMQLTAPLLNGVGTIHPNSPSVAPGGSVVFTASVGGSTSSVAWTSTGGSWSTNTWTAPATPGTYTIKATSAQDATKFVTTTVRVQ